jgi:hypothetical protein
MWLQLSHESNQWWSEPGVGMVTASRIMTAARATIALTRAPQQDHDSTPWHQRAVELVFGTVTT